MAEGVSLFEGDYSSVHVTPLVFRGLSVATFTVYFNTIYTVKFLLPCFHVEAAGCGRTVPEQCITKAGAASAHTGPTQRLLTAAGGTERHGEQDR